MINDKIIPEADDEHKPPSQYGQNTEQTPEMFDSYVDKEFALPRGLDSELFPHQLVYHRDRPHCALPWCETIHCISPLEERITYQHMSRTSQVIALWFDRTENVVCVHHRPQG